MKTVKFILNRILLILLNHPNKWEFELKKLRKKEEEDDNRKQNYR
jgi:hypothetical protein